MLQVLRFPRRKLRNFLEVAHKLVVFRGKRGVICRKREIPGFFLVNIRISNHFIGFWLRNITEIHRVLCKRTRIIKVFRRIFCESPEILVVSCTETVVLSVSPKKTVISCTKRCSSSHFCEVLSRKPLISAEFLRDFLSVALRISKICLKFKEMRWLFAEMCGREREFVDIFASFREKPRFLQGILRRKREKPRILRQKSRILRAGDEFFLK